MFYTKDIHTTALTRGTFGENVYAARVVVREIWALRREALRIP